MDDSQDNQEMTLQQQLEDHRDRLTEHLKYIKITAAKADPPIVQEVILAQRHLEDCRMRLGVALALVNGLDPWANKINKEQ